MLQSLGESDEKPSSRLGFDKPDSLSANAKSVTQPFPIYDPSKQATHPMQMDPKVPVGAPLILEGLTRPHALDGYFYFPFYF